MHKRVDNARYFNWIWHGCFSACVLQRLKAMNTVHDLAVTEENGKVISPVAFHNGMLHNRLYPGSQPGIVRIRETDTRTYLRWNDSYSVGIASFDNDHKVLFNIVNGLYEGIRVKEGRPALVEALHNLGFYVKGHFRSEELAMQKYGYPNYDKHKKEHDDCVKEVGDYCHRVRAHDDLFSEEVLASLVKWLVGHVNGTDKLYSLFLINKGVE